MLAYWVLLVSLILSGCADRDAKAPMQKDTPPTALMMIHSAQELNQIGKGLAVSQCDGAVPTKVQQTPNAHDPKIMDEIQVVNCDGLEISTYFAKYFSPPKAFPVQMILRTKDKRFPSHIAIGTRAEDIVRTLGTPLKRDDAGLVYQADSEGLASDTITFKIAKGVVMQIEWDWYFP